MDKVIQKQLALLKFAILPGILGGIACFIGPPHSALIKANIGVVIGFALQVNIPFTALRYFKTFEKALIMDMNG